MCVLLGKLQVSFHLSLTCVGKGIGITCHGLMQFSGDCRMETNVDLAGFMTPWKLYNNLKLDPITVVWMYRFGCSFVFYKSSQLLLTVERRQPSSYPVAD